MPLVELLWYPPYASAAELCTPDLHAVEIQIDDRLGAGAHAERQRQAAQQRRHGGHDDRAETQQASLENGRLRALAFVAFGFEREVDHHDGVLFYDANEQNDPDHSDDAQIGPTEP